VSFPQFAARAAGLNPGGPPHQLPVVPLRRRDALIFNVGPTNFSSPFPRTCALSFFRFFPFFSLILRDRGAGAVFFFVNCTARSFAFWQTPLPDVRLFVLATPSFFLRSRSFFELTSTVVSCSDRDPVVKARCPPRRRLNPCVSLSPRRDLLREVLFSISRALFFF